MDGRHAYRWRAAFGIAAYLLLTFLPVALMLLPPADTGREPLREFSVALAFCAAGVLGTQFALSSRLKRLKAPYGIDAVYRFHRNMALVALGLVVLHPILLFVVTPERLALLNIFTAPWAARFGLTAVLLVAVIAAISLWRLRFGIGYELWRGWHGALALGIVALVALHVTNTGIYTNGWKLSTFVVYPIVWAGFYAYLRVAKPLWQRAHPYRIEQVRRQTPDTWTLSVRPDGHNGLRFRAGQFLWITIGRSPFSLRQHPFSFSSSPLEGDGGFEVTVKELGDFTSTIGHVRPGTVAYVDGPFGAFTLDRYPASRYVFLAGGIGITPIVSILRTAALDGNITPMVLVYGAATLDDLAFAEEIEALKGRLNLTTAYVLERPPDGWDGPSGFITADVLGEVAGEEHRPAYFICGPPPMIAAMERVLGTMDVDPKRLHYERFAFV